MDWGASGIRNEFQFEAVHHTELDNRLGWLDCVTGGQLDFGYRTDLRASGTLDIDGELPDGSFNVRVWHTATLGDESVRECLGTFMVDASSLTKKSGRYTGTANLYHTGLFKLSNRYNPGNRTLSSYRGTIDYIRDFCGSSGAQVDAHVQERNVPWTHVSEAGTTFLSMCHDLANAIGARLDAGPMGAVEVNPYTLPKYKATSIIMPSGSRSTIMPSLGIERPEIVNRVICRVQDGDNVIVRSSEVDAAHPWSRYNIGYWAEKEYSPSEIKDVASLQRYAKQMLAELTSGAKTYKVESLYIPFTAGQVCEFVHDGERLRGMIASATVKLDAVMKTTMTIEEV